MGLLIAADILGFALFQLMQVRLGTVDGASTQIVMMLTSFCYMPAVGIAMAGTTLVGQAIGAHRRDWAFKVGNGIILMAVLYMGVIGVLLAAAGPWVLPFFTNRADPHAAAVAARGCVLLWIAAGYQLFDGFNISSSACLRGAGDVRLPAVMVLALSWLLFVPLAHSLSFAARRRLGGLVAAIRLGRGRRMVCGLDLCVLPGVDAIPSLVVRRMAAHMRCRST